MPNFVASMSGDVSKDVSSTICHAVFGARILKEEQHSSLRNTSLVDDRQHQAAVDHALAEDEWGPCM